MRHGSGVSIGGLVVARQRPGTANGIVFLLIEDEVGTVNLIVPPRIYERDRLTVRTEPLVLVEGTLERHAAAGGAINILVRRMVPLDAADLRTERPAATVKDFSPLDERERQRILEEQPLVAVAGGGAAPAVADAGPRRGGRRDSGGRGGGRDGALAAVAAGGAAANRCCLRRAAAAVRRARGSAVARPRPGHGSRRGGEPARHRAGSVAPEPRRRCRSRERRRAFGAIGPSRTTPATRRACRGTRSARDAERPVREHGGLRGLPRRRAAGHELRAGAASMTGIRVRRRGSRRTRRRRRSPGCACMFPAVITALAFIITFIVVGLVVVAAAFSGGRRQSERPPGPTRRSRRFVGIGVGVGRPAAWRAGPGARDRLGEGQQHGAPGGVKLTTSEERRARHLRRALRDLPHARAAAHAVGKVGPNLDQLVGGLDPKGQKAFILNAIQQGRAQGRGQMPAGLVDGQDAQDVANVRRAVGRRSLSAVTGRRGRRGADRHRRRVAAVTGRRGRRTAARPTTARSCALTAPFVGPPGDSRADGRRTATMRALQGFPSGPPSSVPDRGSRLGTIGLRGPLGRRYDARRHNC